MTTLTRRPNTVGGSRKEATRISMESIRQLTLCTSAIVVAAATLHADTFPPTVQGPSSSQTPSSRSGWPGWTSVAIVSTRTAGGRPLCDGWITRRPGGPDRTSGRRAGIADPGYITVFMNHEIPAGSGVTRAHGQAGALVSQWTIHLNTLQVQRGERCNSQSLHLGYDHRSVRAGQRHTVGAVESPLLGRPGGLRCLFSIR